MSRFTVEFGDAYGRNQFISSLRERVRGRFSLSDMHARPEGCYSVGDAMSVMPEVPGVHMQVDTSKKTVRLYDPLEDDTPRMRRIASVLKDNMLGFDGQLGAMPEKVMTLTDDVLKTLLAELIRKRKNKSLWVKEGNLPSTEDLDKLPGHVLNDPNSSSSLKAKYKKDAREFAEKLEKIG